MSHLQKSFAKAKLTGLPTSIPEPFIDFDEDDISESTGLKSSLPPKGSRGLSDHFSRADQFEISDDSSSASSASSTGTIKPTLSKSLFARPSGSPSNKRSFDPIPWTSYFERELFLTSTLESDSAFRQHVYLTSPTGSSPLFVCHHGAGSSGMSFAVLTSEIRKILPGAGVLSIDARGHGYTSVTPRRPQVSDENLDLSLGTLTNDLYQAINLTSKQMSWASLPPLILIGHSLGGAVTTSLAHGGQLGSSVLGYVVLDVVEGSAMDALQSMQTYLSTRPTGFSSLSQGIEWHVRSRTIRNTTSARVSVPSLLVEKSLETSSQEESIDSNRKHAYRWVTNLGATQPFWSGWFTGLSNKFLAARGGKLLLLAGTDRLDKELMIGQMQGKYALQVFPEAGHFIHEDLPEKTASVVVDFWKRNDRGALVLPPKVGELLRQGKKV